MDLLFEYPINWKAFTRDFDDTTRDELNTVFVDLSLYLQQPQNAGLIDDYAKIFLEFYYLYNIDDQSTDLGEDHPFVLSKIDIHRFLSNDRAFPSLLKKAQEAMARQWEFYGRNFDTFSGYLRWQSRETYIVSVGEPNR